MRWITALLLVLGATSVQAQSVRQSGYVTPGHPAAWVTSGVVQDGGAPGAGKLIGIGVTAAGPSICANSGPITGAYNQICLGATAANGATLSVNNFNGAVGGLNFTLNGIAQSLPTVALPTVPNAAVCFTNGSGGLGICPGGAGAVNSISNVDGTLTISPSTGSVVASLNLANNNTWTGDQTFRPNTLSLAGATSGFVTLNAPSTGGSTISFFQGSDTVAGLSLARGGTNAAMVASNGGVVYSTASALAILAGTGTAGQCLLSGANTSPSWGACSGAAAVVSVSNIDGSLTISPTTGAVVASLNVGHANTWTADQTYTTNNFSLAGATSGTSNINAPASGGGTATLFAGSDTIAGLSLARGGTNAVLTASNGGVVYSTAATLAILAGTPTAGQCLVSGASSAPSWASCSGAAAVSSVSNIDGTLTISPTTGAVVASLNLAHANTWSAVQTFPNASITAAMLGSGAASSNVGNLSGDLTGNLPAPTVAKVNGTSVPTSPSSNTVLLASSGTAATWTTVPNAALAQMPATTVKCNSTGASGPPLDCTASTVLTLLGTSPWTGAVVQTATHNFYSNLGARINNLNDRVFVGGATAYNGSSTQDSSTWLGQLTGTSGVNQSSVSATFYQMDILTDASNLSAAGGLLVGAQSKLQTSSGPSIIALFPIAVNNNTSVASDAWGLYVEAHRLNSTSSITVGAEIEIRNLGSVVTENPYFFGQPNFTEALGLGCGAGQTNTGQQNCTVALQIFSNTMPFQAGIQFSNGSIAAVSGTTNAIQLPANYEIVWYISNTTTPKSGIYGGTAGKLNFFTGSTGVNIDGAAGASCGPGFPSSSFQSFEGFVIAC